MRIEGDIPLTTISTGMTKGIGESQAAAAASDITETEDSGGGLRGGFVDGIQATPDAEQWTDAEPPHIFAELDAAAGPAAASPPSLRAKPAFSDGSAA